jgi:hypothetical protein
LDGRVLVVGGNGRSGALNVAEIYDPATGLFHTAATQTTAFHVSHTATLLRDGTVLIVSGSPPMLIVSASAEIFDPLQESWSSVGDLLSARSAHAAVLLPDGDVLMTGGRSAVISRDVVRFRTATRTFVSLGALDEARDLHTATLISKLAVLIVGGAGDVGDLGNGELLPTDFPRHRAVAH